MEIKAKATCDLESVKALVHLWMFKKSDPKKRMIMWTVLYAILMSVIIVEMILLGVSKVMLLLLGVGIFVCLLEGYWYFILPRIRYNAMAQLKNAVNEYTFYDDMMRVTTKGDECSGESEIKYTGISRVYETSKYFFMYQTKNQALVVDKRTFEGTSANEVSERLQAVLGKKYVICNY